MNKIRLNQILTILLAPYCEAEFIEEGKDFIEDIRYKYVRLRERSHLMLERERIKRDEDYIKSEKRRDRFLQTHSGYFTNSLDDAVMLINLFFPESEIADLYQNTPGDIHAIEKYYLLNLFKIAESLLTFRDGRLAIRTWNNPRKREDIRYYEEDLFGVIHVFDKVETWNLLNRMMTPDILEVAFLIKARLTDIRYLRSQGTEISLADTTLEKVLEKGVGETHFHMNAGAANEYYWENAINYINWERAVSNQDSYELHRKKTGPIDWPLVLFRLLIADYLEDTENEEEILPFIKHHWGKYYPLIHGILDSLYFGTKMQYRESWRELYGVVLQYYEDKNRQYKEHKEKDYLLHTIYHCYQYYCVSAENIFLLQYLKYLCRNVEDRMLRHLFFQYIRKKNEFYHMNIQANQIEGLKNFRIFSDTLKRRNQLLVDEKGSVDPGRQIEIVFRSISVNKHLQKLEFRTQPSVRKIPCLAERARHTEVGKWELKRDILKRIENVLEGLRRYAVQITGCFDDNEIKSTLDQGVDSGELVFPSIGIIFHFLKRDYVDNRIADSCWLLEKEKRPAYSMHILQWREQMIDSAKAIEELRSEIPGLAGYIVGIDAASEENQSEPWIFAPVYAEIRNRYITKPLLEKEGRIIRIQNMGFTYHVGEEFRHALSGFRHVDEVLRFFHYKAGDRIGHAVVLGIDIERWAHEHENVVVPVGEYLDDLLWLWGDIVHDEIDVEVSLDIIEGKILDLAGRIYGNIVGMTPNILYDAYCTKFKRDNSKIFVNMRKYMKQEQMYSGNHFCKHHLQDGIVNEIWTSDKILCTFFCPIYHQKLQKPIMIPISPSMVRLMKAIQEQLLQKIERMGIYVEVNPTSNLAIGIASDMDDSHIFRLNSVDGIQLHRKDEKNKHKVLLTINSDDLAIFNTSCENELAYMYHSMTHQGYDKEDTLQWIDKIRQYGLDSSFVKHIRKPSQQYDEIKVLLKKIREY